MYGMASTLAYLIVPDFFWERLLIENRLILEDALINLVKYNIKSINEDRKEQIFVRYMRFKIVGMQKKTSYSACI